MKRFLSQRLLLTIPTILGVSVLVFLMLRLTPGDPAQILAGPSGTPEQLAELHRKFGLDEPLYTQYFIWLTQVFHLDLGRSYVRQTAALPLVLNALRASLLLIGTALVISTAIGVAVGVVSAAKRGTSVDRVSMLLALIGLSMPDFWVGIMLILLFAVTFQALPSGGMFELGSTDPGDIPRHIILPAITLAAGTSAVMARVTRSSMLDVLALEYIQTARSKGASFLRVNYLHALRNALIPIVTLLGIQFGFLLSSDILTEYVFSWPGLGQLLLQSVQQRDFPLIQGCVLVIAIIFVVVNLVVDATYALIDPRIRHA